MPEELVSIRRIRPGWVEVMHWTPAGDSVQQIPLASDDARCRRLAEELRQLARFVESGGSIHETIG